MRMFFLHVFHEKNTFQFKKQHRMLFQSKLSVCLLLNVVGFTAVVVILNRSSVSVRMSCFFLSFFGFPASLSLPPQSDAFSHDIGFTSQKIVLNSLGSLHTTEKILISP